MQHQELYNNLSLPSPWKIRRINTDASNNSITIDVICDTKKRSFFSRAKDVVCPKCKQVTLWTEPVQYLTIRHTNVENNKIYLRVPMLEFNCSQAHADCPLRLYNNPNLPYSRKMEQKIREFWSIPNGVNIASVELELQPEEIERLIEHGWLPRSGVIPPVSHPVWENIIMYRIPLKTKNLGLQCLLTWANGQLQRDNLSDSDRLSKIGMVRSYFEKYRNTLRNELEQLLNVQGASR